MGSMTKASWLDLSKILAVLTLATLATVVISSAAGHTIDPFYPWMISGLVLLAFRLVRNHGRAIRELNKPAPE